MISDTQVDEIVQELDKIVEELRTEIEKNNFGGSIYSREYTKGTRVGMIQGLRMAITTLKVANQLRYLPTT